MKEFKPEDFTRCPESSCDNFSPVELDYYYDGSQVFLSFDCPDCSASSLEDDFAWYVRCPSCHETLEDASGRVEMVDGEVDDGLVCFECEVCGVSAESYVGTRWDAEK